MVIKITINLTKGVEVGYTISYEKSSVSHESIKQFGQSGLNILKVVLLILKLCLISGEERGSTYILNCEIPPSKDPAKFCSINILVLNPLKVVPLKSEFGKHSGS